MFRIKRNQIIITALVVMIVVAGYLNYMDASAPTARTGAPELALTEDGEIKALVLDGTTGETVEIYSADSDKLNWEIAISDENDYSADYASEDDSDFSDAGVAVFVNSTSDSSYFVQAKLDREQSRSKQKDVLLGLINNENVASEQKAECANQMLTIQERIEKETMAEAMIEAKGFAEAFVRIDNDTVDVVVSKSVLSDAEIAQIEDIVKRKTGMPAEAIRIVPLKKD